jgi:hypothetical protein
MQKRTLLSAVVRKDPLPRGLKIAESYSGRPTVLNAIWILSDIKAKAIVMACSTTFQLPGKRVADEEARTVRRRGGRSSGGDTLVQGQFTRRLASRT